MNGGKGSGACGQDERYALMSHFTIEIASDMTPALEHAVRSLLPQLTSSGRLRTGGELKTMVSSPLIKMFLAKDGAVIVGMISLSVAQMPTGLRSYLEDLVVDSAYRRRGIARALLQAAIDYAGSTGARSLDMTSRPSRQGALRLYEQLGFRRRETNAFRYSFYD